MGLYAGCDLHAKSNYWGIVDGEGKRVFKKKLRNDAGADFGDVKEISRGFGREWWWSRHSIGIGWWIF